MSSRYCIIFTGRVQGVFFRATTIQIARDFAVSGWVRNETDGSVKCLAEGVEAELDRFVEAIQAARGPNIDEIGIEHAKATGEFDGFSIRY